MDKPSHLAYTHLLLHWSTQLLNILRLFIGDELCKSILLFFGKSYDIQYKELNGGAQIRGASSLCVCVCVCQILNLKVGKKEAKIILKLGMGMEKT